jgi:hypothetical protein
VVLPRPFHAFPAPNPKQRLDLVKPVGFADRGNPDFGNRSGLLAFLRKRRIEPNSRHGEIPRSCAHGRGAKARGQAGG